MSTEIEKPMEAVRSFPTMELQEDGSFMTKVESKFQVQNLLGMKTHEAAFGIFKTAIDALGKQAEEHCNLVSAMFAELEPRDGIEAMLIAQMTATHVALTTSLSRVSHQGSYQVRESIERSATRLSRTYLAQMEALKKHRAKAQQTVRVERVNVESGGQAIVGDVNTGARVDDENRR